MPTVSVTRPTGRNEKNESGSYPAFVRVSWIMRFGGVPISVIIPPMLLAKARGMRSLLGDVPAFAAMLTTIGSISATVPVLLTKAPIVPVTSITRRNSLVSLVPAKAIILLLIILARPVWKIAPPTTNRPTIMITTEFEKPERASSGVSIWQSSKASRAHNATRSERTFPLTKSAADISRITSVAII